MTGFSKKIILGSNSPRRKELLAGMGIEFTVDTGNNFIEAIDGKLDPEEVPLAMSEGKSHGFHRALREDELLITADTVVIVDGEVLGKPHDKKEAMQMLSLLSGRTHKVVTAVTLRDFRSESSFSDSTLVTFAELDTEETSFYVDFYKPYDKAGAYGVQEWIGFIAISGIEGSFYNVMGFPTHRVYAELKKFAG